MCPDKQTLSTYFDGELEHPFYDTVVTHVQQCSKCKAELDNFARMKELMQPSQEPDFEQSKQRVWKRVEVSRQASREPRFWRKTLPIPLPLAMAAAAVFFVLIASTFLVFLSGRDYNTPAGGGKTPVAAVPPRNGIHDAELEQLGSVLLEQDMVVEVNMRLPKKSRFYSGEPKLIRAEEFKSLKK